MSRKAVFAAILFAVCLVASNLFEVKIFQTCYLTLTGGFLIFPITYILNDCMSEVYGMRHVRFVVWSTFAVNLFFVLMAQLVKILPGASFWDGQEHIAYVFNANLRITLASLAAFVVGSLVNAKVMVDMKLRQGEHGFVLRAVLSSLAGEAADSVIFFPIAFLGVGMRNMLIMMVTQVFLKTAYEVVMLPVTVRVVRYLKRTENYIPVSRTDR